MSLVDLARTRISFPMAVLVVLVEAVILAAVFL